MKLSYRDQLDRVRSMTKTRQDNGMTDHTYVVYVEKEIELLWLIRPSAVCD